MGTSNTYPQQSIIHSNKHLSTRNQHTSPFFTGNERGPLGGRFAEFSAATKDSKRTEVSLEIFRGFGTVNKSTVKYFSYLVWGQPFDVWRDNKTISWIRRLQTVELDREVWSEQNSKSLKVPKVPYHFHFYDGVWCGTDQQKFELECQMAKGCRLLILTIWNTDWQKWSPSHKEKDNKQWCQTKCGDQIITQNQSKYQKNLSTFLVVYGVPDRSTEVRARMPNAKATLHLLTCQPFDG